MPTVGSATGHVILGDLEVLGQRRLQPGAVQSGEGRDALRLQARVDQDHQPRDVGGIEDDHREPEPGRVGLDVAAQLRGDLRVALQQILAGHALLAWSATRGNEVRSTVECLGDVGGERDARAGERAVVDLLGRALVALGVGVVHCDVGREPQRQRSLHHVGADRTGRAQDGEFVVGQVAHRSHLVGWRNPVLSHVPGVTIANHGGQVHGHADVRSGDPRGPSAGRVALCAGTFLTRAEALVLRLHDPDHQREQGGCPAP